MKRFIFFSVVFLVLMALPLGSAELLFSQPSPVYNFGDELRMTITLRPSGATTDFVRVDLVCDAKRVTLYQSLTTMVAGESRDIVFTPRLDSPLFASLEGECSFEAEFGDDTAESQTFVVTNLIVTELVVPTTVVMPETTLAIIGSARKANGQALNGFARVAIEGTNFSLNGPVSSGAFSFNINLPRTLSPGEHVVRVESYEVNEKGVRINAGSAASTIIAQVVLTRAEIEFQSIDATPGSPFSFTVNAYDQADNVLARNVRYDLFAPDSKEPLLTRLAKTSEPTSFDVNASSVPGYWRIEAHIEELSTKKLFYVNERELASFVLENNNTLVVTNLGNVEYRENLEISVGDYSSIREVILDVGASKRFKLRAPDAAYDVEVHDSNRSFLASGVPLTGRAIDIGEVGGYLFNVWWIAFFIAGLLGVTLITNVYVSRRRTRRGMSSNKTSTSSTSVTRTPFATPAVGIPAGATREPATMVALRVDSESALARNALDEALGIAQHAGASVTSHLNQHLIAFSPRFTKKLENELLAVQIAKEIETVLKGNAEGGSFDFGVGVGKGEIITHPERPGQFTSVGTVVPTAKRLAHSSKRDVLISDDLHAALRTSLKAEKVAGANNAWRVNSITSRESHKGFIDSFLKRQDRK
ncbi:MAG: hypothetical protein AABX53_03570 [Nanoarchaeota archaeon]